MLRSEVLGMRPFSRRANRVRVPGGAVQVGPLLVTFHRTVRMKAGKKNALPPSLGPFPVFRVAEYAENVPAGWDREALFVPIQETEAMWMSFRLARSAGREVQPVAIVVGAGGVNCVTGEKLSKQLVEDGYLVHPPQPWLDGWKGTAGEAVYQFVATEHKEGEGLTVGEQLLGEESRTGAVGIAVYAPRPGAPVPPVPEPPHYALAECSAPEGVLFCAEPLLRAAPAREMGLGKGAEIEQKIYPDPYGLEVWQDRPVEQLAVYLCSAEDFAAITGYRLPDLVVEEHYGGPLFVVVDGHLADVAGSEKFDGLKSVVPPETAGSAVAQAFPGDSA
jgi:hypothetical protein